MAPSIEARIDALARRDRILAITCTALMWLVMVFVFIVASSVAPSTAVAVVMLVSMLLLGIFNTASIVSMVRKYAAHKELIYRQDILNLDRAARLRGRESG